MRWVGRGVDTDGSTTLVIPGNGFFGFDNDVSWLKTSSGDRDKSGGGLGVV